MPFLLVRDKALPQEMWQGVPSIGVTTNKPIIAAVHGYVYGRGM